MLKPIRPKGLIFDIAMCATWILVLVSNIVFCIGGSDPTWVAVFCPLTIVVFEYMLKVLDHYV